MRASSSGMYGLANTPWFAKYAEFVEQALDTTLQSLIPGYFQNLSPKCSRSRARPDLLSDFSYDCCRHPQPIPAMRTK